MDIRVGHAVFTSDGERLGQVAELVERSGVTSFRVDVTMRPDFWLEASCVVALEVEDGEECIVVNFQRDWLEEQKLPEPA